EHGRLLIRSYAATATMTTVPQVPVAGASELVRAKHRGHVACPQASLSNRSTAARPRRDGCATRPRSRQEQGTGRHAPIRRRPCYDRRLPYCPLRTDQRLRERVSSCRAPSAVPLAPVKALSCDLQCPRSAQKWSRDAARDPSLQPAGPSWSQGCPRCDSCVTSMLWPRTRRRLLDKRLAKMVAVNVALAQR